jgi:hypothetical protein
MPSRKIQSKRPANTPEFPRVELGSWAPAKLLQQYIFQDKRSAPKKGTVRRNRGEVALSSTLRCHAILRKGHYNGSAENNLVKAPVARMAWSCSSYASGCRDSQSEKLENQNFNEACLCRRSKLASTTRGSAYVFNIHCICMHLVLSSAVKNLTIWTQDSPDLILAHLRWRRKRSRTSPQNGGLRV